MPRQVREALHHSPAVRLTLKPGRQEHWKVLVYSKRHLGYRRRRNGDHQPGVWLLREYRGSGNTYRHTPLGIADDFGEGMTYEEARQLAMSQIPSADLKTVKRLPPPPPPPQPCSLYRHYDAADDLLYVGISLEPLRRQEQHGKHASWFDSIVKILIERFDSREEALAAEQVAIRCEFPKFNTIHYIVGR